ncbi:MAG: beta-N-acetylhexosaminidase [Clostridia bacterium]|nr:beta-N-acetylhexosaminidase [Clostridia bacterium]
MSKIRFLNLPEEWKQGTAELLPELGLTTAADGTPVTVKRGKGLALTSEGDSLVITAERATDFFRALSHLKSKLDGGADITERCRATTLCLMEDMSRNAVMHMDGVKQMLRDLALMGYDSLMLYTEDTYELPDYPYFGYMRGKYSLAELREIDDYAYALGIEVIPCIQTLAHMKQALNWNVFTPINDMDDILLVGNPETDKLIETMIATMSKTFRSRRINIGMDEAHNLGRGKYLDQNGYRPAHEIILEHLTRVVELCKKYELAPMMWSDMFFRMAFDHKYYVREGEIPAEVAAKIPRDVTLIYWDYYAKDSEFFGHMVDCHTKLQGVPVAFAGGAWRWGTFAPRNRFSLYYSEMQCEECFKRGINDIIVTAWGDNGSETSHFAHYPTLLYFAEAAYSTTKPTKEQLEARARACFDIGFEEFLTVDAPNELPGTESFVKNPINPCKYLLYNDPIEGLFNLHMNPDTVADAYRANEARLRALAGHKRFGYIFENLANLCAILVQKADFSVRLRRAYKAGDKEALKALAAEIPVIVEKLDVFHASHRRQWYTESKPFGFEVQEQRLGGLRMRLVTTVDRINEYLTGAVSSLPELDEEVLPFQPRTVEESPYVAFIRCWGRVVTPCIYL